MYMTLKTLMLSFCPEQQNINLRRMKLFDRKRKQDAAIVGLINALMSRQSLLIWLLLVLSNDVT